MADGQVSYDEETIQIGSVTANISALELVSAAGVSAVEAKVMELLQVLAEQSGKVITREELLDRIWGDSEIGDENLTRTIYLLRKALREPHGQDALIKTIPKRGYRLTEAPVLQASSIELSATKDRSVAVLPFKNVQGGKDSVFLAEGLCLDLTNLLSRVPSLRVAPNSSAIQCLGVDQTLEQIARQLNVRYLVTGSFQRIDQKVRIRVQLNDTAQDNAIWANKYDAELDDFYELQDDMIRSISTQVNSEINVTEFRTVLAKRKFDLTVYELTQAAEAERWTYNRDAGNRIIAHLSAALEIDPNNAITHAALVVQLSQNIASSWIDNPGEAIISAKNHLRRAQALDPNHPEVLAAAGVLGTMSGASDKAVPFLERAAKVDPNNPHIRALLGWQSCALYKTAEPIELIKSAERDAPDHPRYAIWANYRGHAEFALGNFEASLDALEESAVRNPNYHLNLIARAYPLLLMGDIERATLKIQAGLDLEPGISLDMIIKGIEQQTFHAPEGHSMYELTSLIRQAWPKQAKG